MSSFSLLAPYPRVLLFGDSHTEFGFSAEGPWISLLSDALKRRCDVIARGYAEYNTRNFLDNIDEIVERSLSSRRSFFGDTSVAATVFLGANDSNDPKVIPSTNQHVPLKEYEKNMRLIISRLIQSGIRKDKLIVIPPTPNDPLTWKTTVENRDPDAIKILSRPPKNNELNRKYYDACVAVAKEIGCEVLEHWDALVDQPGYFSDGLHFSAEGSEVFFRLLWPMVDRRVTEVERTPVWLNLPK